MPRARMRQVPAHGLDGPVSPEQISWGPSGGRAGPGAWAGNPKKRRCAPVSLVGGEGELGRQPVLFCFPEVPSGTL